MTHAPSHQAPQCPFCGADWSEAMMAEYDQFSAASSCSCCAGGAHVAPLPVPVRDLCCDSCGRAIFRKLDV